MRVTRKDNGATSITLTVNAGEADLEPIRRHVIGHFRRSVKVPGFRAGKAPDHLIEQNVSQQAFLDEFMEHALNEIYRRAVDEQKITPVGTPDVQLKKFVPYTEMEFEAVTEILGPVKLPDYKKIRLAKKKVEVTAADINDVIKSLQSRMAERKEAGRPAKDGDELIIDFEGKDKDGNKINGADGKDYPLVLGSNTFIPGFEENLIGEKAGATKFFEITFPKDYGVPALRSKKVDFEVKVKQVKQLELPRADDEFAAKSGPFASMAELKKDIKRQLETERQGQAETEYNNELVRKIAEKTEIEVPQKLANEENLRLEEQEKQNLIYRGQTWEEHLKEEGITQEQHRERNYPDAYERVKIGLMLSEIAEREGLSVTPEELQIRIQILKGQYQDPQMQAELDKPASQRELQARMLTEKTLAKLTEYASK